MVKLDTREARCDLTSREASKLLCAVLAGCVGAGFRITLLREFFAVCTSMAADPGNLVNDGKLERLQKVLVGINGMPVTEAAKLHTILAVMSAAFAGIAEQTPDGALVTVSQWISEHDEVWQALEKQALELKQRFPGTS